MADMANVINELNGCIEHIRENNFHKIPFWGNCQSAMMDALELLKPLAESKRPENLRERRAGQTRVHLGDCPVCHRVVEFAQKHCHNCVQLLDWTEVLEMPCEDEDSPET